MGLEGEAPSDVDTSAIPSRVMAITEQSRIRLLGVHSIPFIVSKHLLLHKESSLPQHPNGMRFSIFDGEGTLLATNEYFSVGGTALL